MDSFSQEEMDLLFGNVTRLYAVEFYGSSGRVHSLNFPAIKEIDAVREFQRNSDYDYLCQTSVYPTIKE